MRFQNTLPDTSNVREFTTFTNHIQNKFLSINKFIDFFLIFQIKRKTVFAFNRFGDFGRGLLYRFAPIVHRSNLKYGLNMQIWNSILARNVKFQLHRLTRFLKRTFLFVTVMFDDTLYIPRILIDFTVYSRNELEKNTKVLIKVSNMIIIRKVCRHVSVYLL